jgi:hypothetical protein
MAVAADSSCRKLAKSFFISDSSECVHAGRTMTAGNYEMINSIAQIF